jgi:hypothetical protein
MNCSGSNRIWKRSPNGRRHWLARALCPAERQMVLAPFVERFQDRSPATV